jgi:hypothetical protein
MSRTVSLGGTANFGFAENAGGFVVAMTGEFNGGAFAKVVGEPRREGNRTYAELEHIFIRQDGSMIFTRDKAEWVHVDGDARVLAATTYTVVRCTGAFEGLKGTFRSWGSLNPQTGEGVLRFAGSLSD